MRRYVGLEVIAGTAQVGCKIDGRIDDEPVLAENIGQGFGRELFGCDGQFHWAVQGIGPLGRQDAVADVQGRLVQMDNTVFHLDIDIGRPPNEPSRIFPFMETVGLSLVPLMSI